MAQRKPKRPLKKRVAKNKEIAVALVSETTRLRRTELKRVAQAIQKQLQRDLEPAWRVHARIEVFAKARDVPADHWPVLVRDEVEGGMVSFHSQANNRPFAMVAYTSDWSKSASHDVMEMLIDPFARRTQKGPSVVPGKKHDVDYLVQVCDPCAAGEYRIDDVLVSDFSLPSFWTREESPDRKYSHTGLLRAPFQIARGGYLSWRDPKTRHWWQKVWWNARPELRDLSAGGSSSEEESPDTGAGTGSRRTRAIRFRLTALRAVYQRLEPQLDSARAAVESLIQRFG